VIAPLLLAVALAPAAPGATAQAPSDAELLKLKAFLEHLDLLEKLDVLENYDLVADDDAPAAPNPARGGRDA